MAAELPTVWRNRVNMARDGAPLDAVTMEALVDDEAPQVRFWLARRPDLPPTVAERLRADPEPAVRNSLLINGSVPLPQPTLDLVETSDVMIRRCLARRPGLEVEALAALANDDDPVVRGFAAGNAGATSAMIEAALDDAHWSVRASVVAHLDRLPWVGERLAADGDECVRSISASNEACPAVALEILGRDPSPAIRATVAGHRGLTETAAAGLTIDTDPDVRRRLASNPALSFDAVAGLVGDNQAEVRAAVARRPDLPADVFDQLSRDSDERVRAAAVAATWNREVAPDLLLRMAADPSPMVRDRVARRPGPLGEALGLLLAHDHKAILTRVDDPLTDHDLEVLARSDDVAVRKAIGGRDRLPVELMRLLAVDRSDGVRRAIAKRADTPEEILAALVDDPDRSVRRAAQKALDDRT